ncbi:MAG TPA: hypothetical protein VFR81_28225 [Longimicrobium sp.]|nr:hypothetical protein [Longimicrobium sp.]
MKKLRLELDELAVETFDTQAAPALEGTVHGYFTQVGTCSFCHATCIETGCDTCDNSLDYCTCACTEDCIPRPTRYNPESCPCYLEPV